MKATWAWALLLAIPVLTSACGSGEGERTDLPEGFPDDFPIYEGAHPIEIDAVANQIGVRFETEAPRQEVTDFYRQALDQPPWQVLFAQDVVFENESLLRFKDNDNEVSGSVGVVFIKDTGKTNFVVRLTFRSRETPSSTSEESPAPDGG